MNQKLINNPFFNSLSPTSKFECGLVLMSSVAYLICERKDLLQEVEYFLIRNQLKILDVKDKTIIIAVCLVMCYFSADIFAKKEHREHAWTYFTYFTLLFNLRG